jgi:hypothetical protein
MKVDKRQLIIFGFGVFAAIFLIHQIASYYWQVYVLDERFSCVEVLTNEAYWKLQGKEHWVESCADSRAAAEIW